MHKVIEILKKNLAEENEKVKNSGLNPSRLDVLYKLTETIENMEYMENENGKVEWKSAEKAAENDIKKYSNGKYDKNIDALYDAYIESKINYQEMGDQGHREKLMRCVRDLIVEVHDMLHSMKINSDFKEERDEIMKYIRMLADA